MTIETMQEADKVLEYFRDMPDWALNQRNGTGQRKKGHKYPVRMQSGTPYERKQCGVCVGSHLAFALDFQSKPNHIFGPFYFSSGGRESFASLLGIEPEELERHITECSEELGCFCPVPFGFTEWEADPFEVLSKVVLRCGWQPKDKRGATGHWMLR